jgi:hypothetical protein
VSLPPSKRACEIRRKSPPDPANPFADLSTATCHAASAACCSNYVGTDIIVGTISRSVDTTLENVRNRKGE